MSVRLDADVHRSAAHRNMAEQLTAPFAAGAAETDVPIDAAGVTTVAWTSRQSLLVAEPRAALARTGLLLATTSPPGAEFARFVAYTEAGASVLLRKLALDSDGRAPPFTVTLSLWELDADGKLGAAFAKTAIAGLVRVSLIEGVLGQMAFAMAGEKHRLRRESRVLAAARGLDDAHRSSLDGIGADLGVRRFGDVLALDGREIFAKASAPESDASYRRRLRIYRPTWRPTRASVLEALNGPPPPTAPNAGPIAQLAPGLLARFAVDDVYAPFAVAIKIVAAGDPASRPKLLDWVRDVFLIWPAANVAANVVHANRFLSARTRARVTEARKAVRDHFDLYAGSAAIAPMLGDALVRAARCRAELGLAAKWELARGQEATFGSRFELGLGALVGVMTVTELDDMAKRAKDPSRPPAADPELEAVLQVVGQRAAAGPGDPEGRWLLEPCGLQTVRQVSSKHLYVSHLPNHGLRIAGPDAVPAGGWSEIVAAGITGDASPLAFYDRTSGELEVYSSEAFAGPGLTGKTTAAAGKGWMHAVAGRFVSKEAALLVYDSVTGKFGLFVLGSGGITDLTSTLNLPKRPGWTHLAAIRLGSGAGLLAYDALAGEAAYFTAQAQAKFVPRWSDKAVPRGWSALTGFGTGRAAAYDRRAGRLTLVTPGPKRLEHGAEVDGLPSSCTDLCGLGSELRLHDPLARTVTIVAVGATGEPERLPPIAVPGDATRMVCGRFGGATQADTLLYDRTTGRATFTAVDRARGAAQAVRVLTGLRSATGTAYTIGFHEPGDAAGDAVLQAQLAAARAKWGSRAPGGWTIVAQAAADAALAKAEANATVRGILERAALPAPADPLPTVAKLRAALTADPSSMAVLRLDAPFGDAILRGGGAHDVRELADTLADERVASAFAVATSAPDLLVVVSAAELADVGASLANRNPTGFQWQLVPLTGRRGRLTPVPGGVSLTPGADGVYALVAIGFARLGSNRPFEFHVDLPPGATLSLEQYEFLMNVLEHAHPLGVGVNTFALRREHVDLDGDGKAEPVPPTISRTFRRFRRRRRPGESLT